MPLLLNIQHLKKYTKRIVNIFLLAALLSSAASKGNATGKQVDEQAALTDIWSFGKQMGWSSVLLENKLSTQLAPYRREQLQWLVQFFRQARTKTAQFLAMKSWLCGDDFKVLQRFINELNQYPETEQAAGCSMITAHTLIQQWEFSCSVTVLQAFLADLCPRYAWKIKQINGYDALASDPYMNPMGQQQKTLLEKYGGQASKRGDYSGKSIGIVPALNEWVGRILNTQFSAVAVTDPASLFSNIRSQLNRGIAMPLLVGFIGSQARHFILVLHYTQTNGSYRYLVYDPWEGRCAYVDEYAIRNNSFNPLLAQWNIRVDYYFPAA